MAKSGRGLRAEIAYWEHFRTEALVLLRPCCGSGSVSGLDPDSIVSLDPYPDSPSWFRRAKMIHKNRKKGNKLNFLKYWIFSCKAEGFSCSLDVLYGGLGISKLLFLIKKDFKQFQLYIFFNFWSSKPWIRVHLKCWIRSGSKTLVAASGLVWIRPHTNEHWSCCRRSHRSLLLFF